MWLVSIEQIEHELRIAHARHIVARRETRIRVVTILGKIEREPRC